MKAKLGIAAIGIGLAVTAFPHGDETAFGRSGDPNNVSRSVQIDMSDAMQFTPDDLTVKQGETIRFVVKNSGAETHEMVLGTMAELTTHARMMKEHPGTKHDEPHALQLAPERTGVLVWQFTEAGEFHYACLIADHFDQGMVGRVRVLPAR
jgi:uncharacterized cupredoxin-like copper-binding protein